MKCISLSDRVYYKDLNEEFVSALKADMSLYNSMVHKAYKYLSDRYKGFNTYKDSEIEQLLKKEYNTNDYFPLSTLWLAKSYLKNDTVNYTNHRRVLLKKLSNINRKINDTLKEIQKIDKKIDKLIDKSRKGKYKESDYLKEVTVLKPNRKKLNSKLKQLRFIYKRVNTQYEHLTVKFRYFDSPVNIYVTGRKQALYSNNLFLYDTQNRMMKYRSSSNKKNYEFKLKFHYMEDLLLSRINQKRDTVNKAVCYELIDKGEYFIIKATFELDDLRDKNTDYTKGVLGIDINADHIAYTVTDSSGNPVKLDTIKLDLINRNGKEKLHDIRNVCKRLSELALSYNVPIIKEDLDFNNRKDSLRYQKDKGYNRMISSFAYKRFDEALESRCLKDVVPIIKVNPAYTSKTAKSRYCPVMGCSVHMAASYLIARTGQFTY